jgi:hypothetical protein
VTPKFRSYSFDRLKKGQSSFSENSDTSEMKNSHISPANPNADNEETVPLDHNSSLINLRERSSITSIGMHRASFDKNRLLNLNKCGRLDVGSK